MSFPSPIKLHLIGDSIVNNMYAVSGNRTIITAGGSMGGAITLTNQAVNGDIIQGQTTLWQANALRGDSSLSAVFVQCGVNNAKGGDQAHLVMGFMETLIEDIRANNPGAKILMSQMLPCGIYLDNLGTNPNHRGNVEVINALFKARYGADSRLHDMFNNPRSTGDLLTEFDSGDGIHPAAIGYQAQAKQIRIWMDQLFPDSASNAYARMTDGQSPATMRIIDLASAVKAKTDNLPATPAAQADVTTVGTAVAAVSTKLGTPAGASVSVDVAAVKTDTAAIKAKTDNLPSNPAAQTNLDVAVSSRAPNSTAVSNADLTPTRAGKLDNLDVAVSTRNSVVPDNAGIASALAAATNAMRAALGLFVVIGAPTYNPGTPDLATVSVRLYDSQAHAMADDGVTGLVVPEFARTIAYSGVALTGTPHRIAKVTGA